MPPDGPGDLDQLEKWTRGNSTQEMSLHHGADLIIDPGQVAADEHPPVELSIERRGGRSLRTFSGKLCQLGEAWVISKSTGRRSVLKTTLGNTSVVMRFLRPPHISLVLEHEHPQWCP